MRKVYLIFLMFSIFGFSQKKEGQALIDSLLVELPKMKEDTLKVIAINDLSFTYQNIDPEIGLQYAKKALELSKKLSWKDGIAESYRVTGVNYSVKSEFEKSLKYYFLAEKFTKNKSILCKIYRNIGLIYTYQNDFPKALKYGNLSLKLCEEIKDIKGQAAVLSNIGIIYFDLNNFTKAIQYYEKARIINEKMNNLGYLVNNLGNLANCYTRLKKYNLALLLYDKAIQISDSQNNKYSKAIYLASKGHLFYDLKQYDKTLEFTNQSLQINLEIGNENDLAFNIGVIGDTYLAKALIEKNKNLKAEYLKKAFQNLNETLVLKKKLGITKEIANDYLQFSIAQELQGDYKSALKSERLAKIYKDSVYNENNKETIKNIEDKREIELRDKELKINKLSLEANQKQKWFYILGIGFLAILGGLFFYQSYKRKQINLKLETLNQNLDQANKTKTRFFSILNHDLRSPVANLIHFLHLQKDNPELLDEATKTRMQDKTITGAENLLSSMEDILLWSKGQMDNFKPQPKQIAIKQLFDDTKKVFSGYLKISFVYENPENLEVFTDENYLKTIIRNLTSNAINVLSEYVTTSAVEKQIIWKAYKLENKTFLSITDNGPGATQDQFKALYDDTEVIGIKSGLGLHLIRDLATAIDCEISVDSKIGFGTTFVLKFK